MSFAENDPNIGSALTTVAERWGHRIGLVTYRNRHYRTWSFAELAQTTRSYAAALADAGIRAGERVMLMLRPSVEFICLSFALFQLRAVVILIDPGMGYSNLLRCITSVRPAVLIAIPQVLFLSRLFPRQFASLRLRICVGRSFGLLGRSLASMTVPGRGWRSDGQNTAGDDLAAIIFTTGSTGPPKGVHYTHGIFHAQLEQIRDSFGITASDVDQPGFPLFGLFSIALGAKTVIPDMDPSRPAQVNPRRFVSSILDQKVTYSFGSPAIWRVVSQYCRQQRLTLPLHTVLMAGAPVPGELVAAVQAILDSGGEVITPYGATECLPVTAIGGGEILSETWRLSCQGRGTCVGRPLPGMDVRIIRPREGSIADWADVVELVAGETGEIVASGPVVTRQYDHDSRETRLAKIRDGDRIWHRMGDMGYLDTQGRLWFCGRKAHRVQTANGVMYPVPCEAIFNEHPKVFRSALVGVGKPGNQLPVLIVELHHPESDQETLFAELRVLAEANPKTRQINTFLIHPGFPVDIRHNAKIFREKLALWAQKQLMTRGCLEHEGL